MKQKIKVAMVSPSFSKNSGPEIAVQNLVAALIERGIDVTLFAPGDWKTKAKHIATLPKSLSQMKDLEKKSEQVERNYTIASQLKVLNFQKSFDLIHIHLQGYAAALGRLAKKPCVLTFHSRIIPAELNQIKRANVRTVSVTKSQAGKNKTTTTIWHGLPLNQIKFFSRPEKYLITVGRIIDQKGIDLAVKIAKKSGQKLLIIGRVGSSIKRQNYFNKKIKPFLGEDIIFIGEKSHQEVLKYIGKASALLFPIRHPEVFGLVAAEALACGTPVIGTAVDPLPEILGKKNKEKVSFLSNNINQLIKAAKNTDKFDRQQCRKYAERYFDNSVMAEKYIRLYERILKKGKNRY